MRFRNAATALLSTLAVATLTAHVLAQGSSSTNPSTNSGQAVPVSLLDIEDKSPMSSSADPSLEQDTMTFDLFLRKGRSGVKVLNRIPLSPQQVAKAIVAAIKLTLRAPENAPLVNRLELFHNNLKAGAPTQSTTFADFEQSLLTDTSEQLVGDTDGSVQRFLRSYLELTAATTGDAKTADPQLQALIAMVNEAFMKAPFLTLDVEDATIHGESLSITGGSRSTRANKYYERGEYSEGWNGWGLTAQSVNTNTTAFSFGGKVDLSPNRHKNIKAVAEYDAAIRFYGMHPTMPQARKALSSLYIAILLNKARLGVVKNSNNLHITALTALTSVNGAGYQYTYGISSSKFLYQSPRGWALNLTGAIQETELYARESQHPYYITLPGVAIAWQDAVSTSDKNEVATVRRWRTQFGAEYSNYHGDLGLHDTFDAFMRKRLRDFSEIKLLAGQDQHGDGFIGFEFGHTFAYNPLK